MDVTLCTASILHLCCISLDRYFAIVNRPLLYYQRVTTPRVVLSVLVVWALSLMTGFLPVFTGIYSSEEHLRLSRLAGGYDESLLRRTAVPQNFLKIYFFRQHGLLPFDAIFEKNRFPPIPYLLPPPKKKLCIREKLSANNPQNQQFLGLSLPLSCLLEGLKVQKRAARYILFCCRAKISNLRAPT